MEKSVFPQPAPPVTNVILPLGKPPPVISSKPVIPVGVLGKNFTGFVRCAGVTKKLLQEILIMKLYALVKITMLHIHLRV
jgi:hypothetical protein